MAEIKAIIFDWGGVLIEDPLPGLMQFCTDALSVSKEEYIQVHNKFADDFSKGIISEEIFWDKVCGELGRPLPQTLTLWGNAFRAVYQPRADMFALVLSLRKAGYKTALLSNTEASSVQFFHGQQYNMFDVLVFSCAEGVMKPERKIYEIAIQRLGMSPKRTVFIDDNPAFIKGAEQTGLNAVLFENIQQVKTRLAVLSVNIK